MEQSRLKDDVSTVWRNEVVPALVDYISIPALSPAFDGAWASHGYLARAVGMLSDWARQLALTGVTVEVRELPGCTPVIVVNIAATNDASNVEPTVLMYGHLDKQPEMEGWAEGLGPWQPIIADGKLYGRGGADDGVSGFGVCNL